MIEIGTLGPEKGSLVAQESEKKKVRLCNLQRWLAAVQPAFEYEYRFAEYEYGAKSFNPQPTARKSLFFTQVVLSISTIRTYWDLSSISLPSGSPRRRRNLLLLGLHVALPNIFLPPGGRKKDIGVLADLVAKESWPRRHKADGGLEPMPRRRKAEWIHHVHTRPRRAMLRKGNTRPTQCFYTLLNA